MKTANRIAMYGFFISLFTLILSIVSYIWFREPYLMKIFLTAAIFTPLFLITGVIADKIDGDD